MSNAERNRKPVPLTEGAGKRQPAGLKAPAPKVRSVTAATVCINAAPSPPFESATFILNRYLRRDRDHVSDGVSSRV
jgi:hypothetical protein